MGMFTHYHDDESDFTEEDEYKIRKIETNIRNDSSLFGSHFTNPRKEAEEIHKRRKRNGSD